MFERVCLIVNPISGSGRGRKQSVEHVRNFMAQHCSDIVLHETRNRGDAALFAGAAVRDKFDLAVALGGDGTVNEVASALVGTDVCLGIIPVGSGNGLARSIYLPQDIEGACQVLLNGQQVRIDVGKLNDRYFFLIAGVGFDAQVGHSFDNHWRRGPLSYFYLAAREYVSYRPSPMKLRIGQKCVEARPFVVAIANGQQYGNNALIAPAAKINDGLLNVLVVHRLPWWRLPTMIPKLFSGKIATVPDTSTFETDALVIERAVDAWVNVDGEVYSEPAVLHISLIPKSLKLMTPHNIPSLAS